MEFTPEDIILRMEVYARYAHRIKELKDLMLEFDIFGDEDLVMDSMHHQEGIIEEIRLIYQEKMVPIIEEMAQYVAEHQHILYATRIEASPHEDEEFYENDGERSRGQALDMGTSLLSSLMTEKTENYET
jgi:hypothetical protein